MKKIAMFLMAASMMAACKKKDAPQPSGPGNDNTKPKDSVVIHVNKDTVECVASDFDMAAPGDYDNVRAVFTTTSGKQIAFATNFEEPVHKLTCLSESGPVAADDTAVMLRPAVCTFTAMTERLYSDFDTSAKTLTIIRVQKGSPVSSITQAGHTLTASEGFGHFRRIGQALPGVMRTKL